MRIASSWWACALTALSLLAVTTTGQRCPTFRSFLDPIPLGSGIPSPITDAAFGLDGETIYVAAASAILRVGPRGTVETVATITDGLGGPYYLDVFRNGSGVEILVVTRPKDNAINMGAILGNTGAIVLQPIAAPGLAFPSAVRFISADATTTRLLIADTNNNRVALVVVTSTGSVTVTAFASDPLLFSPRFISSPAGGSTYVASTGRVFRLTLSSGALTSVGAFVTSNGVVPNLILPANIFIAVGSTVAGSTSILPSSSTGTLGTACTTFTTSAAFLITGSARGTSFIVVDQQTSLWKFNFAPTATPEVTGTTSPSPTLSVSSASSSGSPSATASMSTSMSANSMSTSMSANSMSTSMSANSMSTSMSENSSVSPSLSLTSLAVVVVSLSIPIVVVSTISTADVAAINAALAMDVATYAPTLTLTPNATFASSNGAALNVTLRSLGSLAAADLAALRQAPWQSLRTTAGNRFSTAGTATPNVSPIRLTPPAVRDAVVAAIEGDLREYLLPRANSAGYLGGSLTFGTPAAAAGDRVALPVTLPTAIAGTLGSAPFPRLTALAGELTQTIEVTIPVNVTSRTLTPAELEGVSTLGTLDATEFLGFPANLTNVRVVDGFPRGTLSTFGTVLANGTVMRAPTLTPTTVERNPWTRVVNFLNPPPAVILPPPLASCGTGCRIAVGILAGVLPILILIGIIVMCLLASCQPFLKALFWVFPLW